MRNKSIKKHIGIILFFCLIFVITLVIIKFKTNGDSDHTGRYYGEIPFWSAELDLTSLPIENQNESITVKFISKNDTSIETEEGILDFAFSTSNQSYVYSYDVKNDNSIYGDIERNKNVFTVKFTLQEELVFEKDTNRVNSGIWVSVDGKEIMLRKAEVE